MLYCLSFLMEVGFKTTLDFVHMLTSEIVVCLHQYDSRDESVLLLISLSSNSFKIYLRIIPKIFTQSV